ncbi:MAG TPA: Lrp/AsnC family transcriptional regulator [Chloroflexota bacterium]|nr:Lrp/AsnC family transcriptional regulator [Chloroflexota bacterium]
MDEVDAQILAILQAEGRISMRELGARVGLSGPAAAARVRRLEERGVVLGYRAVVAPAQLGRSLNAFIAVALREGCPEREFEALARTIPEIQECHRITGEDCYLVRVALPDVAALQTLLEQLSRYGRTRTSILLSSPVESKPLSPVAATSRRPPAAVAPRGRPPAR